MYEVGSNGECLSKIWNSQDGATWNSVVPNMTRTPRYSVGAVVHERRKWRVSMFPDAIAFSGTASDRLASLRRERRQQLNSSRRGPYCATGRPIPSRRRDVFAQSEYGVAYLLPVPMVRRGGVNERRGLNETGHDNEGMGWRGNGKNRT